LRASWTRDMMDLPNL